MEQVSIAVIGGSGLYQMAEITEKSSVTVQTPFGTPSADIVIGTLHGKRVAFLPRHGIGHVFTPSTVPYRANIFALKMLGVRYVIGVNACGSLKEEYAPGHIVMPDQVFDYTNHRDRTFFDTGLVGHVSVADPYTAEMIDLAYDSVIEAGGTAHKGGTFLIEEGTRFATRAESHIFRQWGCSLIGMTTCPEVFLAREAEMAYVTMAHVTDYDSWHISEKPVTVDQVIQTLHHNVHIAQQAIAKMVEKLDTTVIYPAHSALENAIMTDRSKMSPRILEQLRPLVQKYLPEG